MKNTTSVGVVVGRFQVDSLHEGHFDLLKEVSDNHDNMLVVIGLSPLKCTVNNPLDFDTRRRMIMEHFPNAFVSYIEDVYSDHVWSKQLDEIINKRVKAGSAVTLYGSRDSFIKHYFGEYPTKELEQRSYISGSEIRKHLALRSRATADFRAGAIWALSNQFPKSIRTVDIAVIDTHKNMILLGKKPMRTKYCIVGGFVMPGDTDEQTAVRELEEETHLRCGEDALHIEKSFFIDDWRYKSEVDKITTRLYVVDIDNCAGRIQPDDDIEEVAWFPMEYNILDLVSPNHVELVKYVIDRYKQI